MGTFSGKKHSLASRVKMSTARLGYSISSEVKAKMSETHNQKYNEILEEGKRQCIRCGDVKFLKDYPKGRKRRDGQPRYAYCKKCHSDYQRAARLRNFFLMSIEDADKIFEYQKNLCAICKKAPFGGKRLALDHRHEDGLVRGGLCTFCNRAIARFKDDATRLRAAADYLENPPAVQALGRKHFARPGRIGTKKQRAIIKKEKRLLQEQKTKRSTFEHAYFKRTATKTHRKLLKKLA